MTWYAPFFLFFFFKIYLVLPLLGAELCDVCMARPTLPDGRVAALPEATARAYMQQILDGLAAAHALGLAHHDVSLENTMLDAHGRCVTIDWGMVIRMPIVRPPASSPLAAAPVESSTKASTMGQGGGGGGDSAARVAPRPVRLCNCVGWPCKCGKARYAAPELLGSAEEVASRQPGFDPFKTDAWACGVMLFVLLTGVSPWDSSSDAEPTAHVAWGPGGASCAWVWARLRTGRLASVLKAYQSFAQFGPLSADAEAVLGALLTLDPEERASVRQAREMPWFQAR